MPQRLKKAFALWFVLQIVVPFMAPLQTCDLKDLLGINQQQTSPASPESSATPLVVESNWKANAFAPSLVVYGLADSTSLAIVSPVTMNWPFMPTFDPSPSPHVQQTVLRL